MHCGHANTDMRETKEKHWLPWHNLYLNTISPRLVVDGALHFNTILDLSLLSLWVTQFYKNTTQHLVFVNAVIDAM